MKLSKYSYIVNKEDLLLLYNCSTEKITVVQPELLPLLKSDGVEEIRPCSNTGNNCSCTIYYGSSSSSLSSQALGLPFI